MDENKVQVADGLPEFCYGVEPTTQLVIVLKRGEMGFYRPKNFIAHGEEQADKLNEHMGVTKAQATAMFMGSMFGWDAPVANPAHYEPK